MRFFVVCIFLFMASVLAHPQGAPPMDSSQVEQPQPGESLNAQAQGTPPVTPPSTFRRMALMAKKQVNKAIDGKTYGNLDNWRPLSTREKFDIFLARTHSPRTFEAAGVDALKDHVRNQNPEYERGFMGLGQRYGVELGTSETEVFFERFLVPSLLKQDPRYFRNPNLPFIKRALYSVSRVLITKADSGHNTLNVSRIAGGAASQALADLYVPGRVQGLQPILDRVTFDLIRDAGFNLAHEFWPDLRRKFLHR
jgi:hypothetical protein